jgi:hypothetical protein
MTSLVCIFSLLVLVSCLRVQLSHQARRQRRQGTSPAYVTRPTTATAAASASTRSLRPVSPDSFAQLARPTPSSRIER